MEVAPPLSQAVLQIEPPSKELGLPDLAVPSPTKWNPPPFISRPHPHYGFVEAQVRTEERFGWLKFMYPLGFLIFGRDPGASHVFVGHPEVSNQHAVTYWDVRDGRCYLVDLESRHGTFINGNVIVHNTPHQLQPGSKIRFGNSAHMYVFCNLPEEFIDKSLQTPIVDPNWDTRTEASVHQGRSRGEPGTPIFPARESMEGGERGHPPLPPPLDISRHPHEMNRRGGPPSPMDRRPPPMRDMDRRSLPLPLDMDRRSQDGFRGPPHGDFGGPPSEHRGPPPGRGAPRGRPRGHGPPSRDHGHLRDHGPPHPRDHGPPRRDHPHPRDHGAPPRDLGHPRDRRPPQGDHGHPRDHGPRHGPPPHDRRGGPRDDFRGPGPNEEFRGHRGRSPPFKRRRDDRGPRGGPPPERYDDRRGFDDRGRRTPPRGGRSPHNGRSPRPGGRRDTY